MNNEGHGLHQILWPNEMCTIKLGKIYNISSNLNLRLLLIVLSVKYLELVGLVTTFWCCVYLTILLR